MTSHPFGDGHDGDVRLDGINQYDFADYLPDIKTYVFTRSVQLNNISIADGITLGFSGPHEFLVRGTFDYRHGHVIGLPVTSFAGQRQ